jgi:hypothetical protein
MIAAARPGIRGALRNKRNGAGERIEVGGWVGGGGRRKGRGQQGGEPASLPRSLRIPEPNPRDAMEFAVPREPPARNLFIISFS